MATNVFTPYSTGVDLFGTKPNWIPNELDQLRILSYQAYEEIYWNVPDVFKVALRGTNNLPIYVPSARTIIDTTHRYTAPSFAVNVVGEGNDAVALRTELMALLTREAFKPKFNGNKRYGLIRGDWLWHLTADTTKAPGTRLRITALDPAMYFPIPDENDVDRIVGVHLVEQIETDDGPRIRRLTYRKVPQASGFNQITVEEGIFEIDKWGGPDARAQTVITPPTPLPGAITSIPVYHIKNFEEPGNPFGSSEIRGLERIMSAVNQTVSDEDLALALEGIGMYATDSSEPVDPRTGNPVPWRLGPGRVVHYDGERFNRVNGVSNLGDTYGAHYNRLWESLKWAASTPDIAIGTVDVQIAQSGIALALQLGPMLGKSGEKNDLIIGTHDQMFFDIVNMWLPAYENLSFDGVQTQCVVGDAVPIDRDRRFAELNDMLDRGVIDTDYYRVEATKLGYVFPGDIKQKADTEFEARNADQFAARVNADIPSDSSA